MIPDKPKDYKDVITTRVWEKIPTDDYEDVINPNGTDSVTRVFSHHLIHQDLSKYIRKLENRIKDLENEKTITT